MAKNIILCSDGTANAGGQGLPTNVWAIYQAIDINGSKLNKSIPRQIAFHDDGVGTQSWKPLRALGGAFGLGLSHNIRQLYIALARNFEPGDQIYLFGFSRGAFTVRSLAGLIASQGILNVQSAQINGPEDVKRAVKRIYGNYRALHQSEPYNLSPDAKLLKKILVHVLDRPVRIWWQVWNGIRKMIGRDFECYHKGNCGKDIQCVGVWDTVDAVGAPFDELRDLLDFLFRNNFHQHGLNRDIKRGYHVLSIDDERKTFHPVMWDEDKDRDRGDSERVKQVWFAGVHSNVGGGYPKQGLAHVSLHWMMRELEADRAAAGSGLHFTSAALEQIAAAANPHDKLYDSRKGSASLYRYSPRDIAKICARACRDEIPKIHDSVFERIARHTHAYAPGQIPREIEIVSTDDGNVPAPAPPPVPISDPGVVCHYDLNYPLLELGAKWIRRRKVIYKLSSISLLAVVVGGVVYYDSSTKTWWPGVPEMIEKGLKPFFQAQPQLLIGLAALLALLFLLRTIFRARANAHHSDFWWRDRKLLPN